MLELDWRVESRGGVALVELVVRNPTATARRVRVANRLDGPVWPPRCEGVPEAGWDDGGFEGVVAPGDRHALGYASPAGPAEPPVELVWSERAGASEADGAPGTITAGDADASIGDASGPGTAEDAEAFTDDATPEGVVRALGDGRPPADAVPLPSDPSDTGCEDVHTGRSP